MLLFGQRTLLHLANYRKVSLPFVLLSLNVSISRNRRKMDFYSVGHRKSMSVPDDKVKKRAISSSGKDKKTRLRYFAVAETTINGTSVKLTKLISKVAFEAMQCEEIKD